MTEEKELVQWISSYHPIDTSFQEVIADRIRKYGQRQIIEALDIAIPALQRIASGKDICVSHEYDSNPTEKELAIQTLKKLNL